MQNQNEIDQLKYKRSKVYNLDLQIVILLLLGVAVQIFIPFLGILFGLLAFIIFYKKMLSVVQTPCPSCKKPFGTDSNFVLSIGPNQCQNCGLKI